MLIRPSQHQFERLYVDARIICRAGKEVLPRNHGLNGRDRVRGYICRCCNRILDGQFCFDCLDYGRILGGEGPEHENRKSIIC
jgi:hypothetical protein